MMIVQDEILDDDLISRPWQQTMLSYLWINHFLYIMVVLFGFNMLLTLDTPILVRL